MSAAFAYGCLGLVIVGMSAASSALGAFTFVGFALDHTNEPNLLGFNPYPGNQNPSVMETLYGEQNLRRIDDGWDTVFAFKEEFATFKVVARFSREPFFLSAAGLPNAASDPILHMLSSQMGYSFLSQTEFVVERSNYLPELRLIYKGDRVLLSSDPHTSLTVSGAPITNGGRDHLVTFKVVGNAGRPNNPIGSYVLAWDDGMSRFGDRDFQDTVIEVTGIGLVVPEPSSVVLVGIAMLFAGVCRKARRLRSKPSNTKSRCRQLGVGVSIVGVAIAFLANPAHAALTPIGTAFDHTNEPNLIGTNPFPDNLNPSVIETLYGEQNVRRIDDAFDTVFVFTEEVATFKVVARFSRERFSLSVANPPRFGSDRILQLTNEVMGYELPSPSEFVVQREDYLPELRFLYSGNRVLLSSDPSLSMYIGRERIDNLGVDQMVTFQVVGNEGRPNNPIGSFVLAWDDNMSIFGDKDFQDTVIEVSGIGLAVPEPSSVVIVGSALLIGGLYGRYRNRRSNANPTSLPRRIGMAMIGASLMLLATPGLAAFTPIQNALDETDEPNLIGINPYPDNLNPSVIETLYGEHNVVRVNDLFDGTFYFTDQVATVKAVAQFSQTGNEIRVGSVKSRRTVTVMSWGIGTQGYRLPEFPTATITDRARFGESFYFEISARSGRLYSETELNPAASDQVVTYRVVGNEGFPDNPIGSYVLAWEVELRPGGDSDFQDTVLELSGVTLAVPEPSTAATVALAMLVVVAWRTRRRNSHGVAS